MIKTSIISNTLETKHDRPSVGSHSDHGTNDKRSKSTIARGLRKGTRTKSGEGTFSKDISNIPRLFHIAKQRLARFYQVRLIFQIVPSTTPAVFVDAEIVVLSTDMRALFWSAVAPGSPKQRFMMPNFQQASIDEFQPLYGFSAYESALKMGYHAVSTLVPEQYGQLCFLKKPNEVLIIRFGDAQLAFRWFQLVILALGLYYVSPGMSLINNLNEKKGNFEAYVRDKIKSQTETRYILNIAEKDGGLPENKFQYKVFSVASLKGETLTESEFVVPYLPDRLSEWEAMITLEFLDLEVGGKTILHEFFRSLEYNWRFRLMLAPFPLFSDTNSKLQQAETLTRAFVCRKKLVQISKKCKEEDLVRVCETAKKACLASESPYDEFFAVSEAFRQAVVLRTFLIAYSVRAMQKKRTRRKGHRRGGRRLTKSRQKRKEEELAEIINSKRGSSRKSRSSAGSADESGSEAYSSSEADEEEEGEAGDEDFDTKQVEEEDTPKDKPRDDCGCNLA